MILKYKLGSALALCWLDSLAIQCRAEVTAVLVFNYHNLLLAIHTTSSALPPSVQANGSWKESILVAMFSDGLVADANDLTARVVTELPKILEREFVNPPGPAHVSPLPQKKSVPVSGAAVQQDIHPPDHPSAQELPHGHRRSWCAPCVWRGFPSAFQSPNSNEWLT